MDYSYGVAVAARKWPHQRALVCADASISFKALDLRINRLACGLVARDVRAGDRVAFLLQNTIEAVELYMALARMGAVAVPINNRSVGAEIAYLLDDSGACLLVYDPAFEAAVESAMAELQAPPPVLCSTGPSRRDAVLPYESLLHGSGAAPPASVQDTDTACLLYTSGTTGKPKGVERTHGANLVNITNVLLAAPRAPGDVEMFSLPISGIGYIHFLLPSLCAGATVVLLRKFDAQEAWLTLVRHQVTRAFLAPTMLQSMLEVPGHEQHGLALQTLDTAYEIPERLRREIVQRFGTNVFHMYGLTEAQLFYPDPGAFLRKPGSNGKPMGLLEYRVVDDEGRDVQNDTRVGELWLRGPSLMKGYFGNPAATADALRNGWLRTGDLGYLDADSDFHFVGRRKEIIKSGGYNVDPMEVENHLCNHPLVRDAVVVGVPDERWGEVVVAFVVLRPGSQIEDAEIADFCRGALSSYKIPKHFFRTDTVPRNATGKAERARMRSAAQALLDSSAEARRP
jgi:acyl-CoA synthetase (AMP-forming)/AMP-acid ligase II